MLTAFILISITFLSRSISIAAEVGYKSTQTNETSFVPCESCAKVQTNLKANADQLINMCHYQDIQSSVGKFRASLMASQLVGGWLSGPELERWLQEQDKDLGRIGKQLEFMTKNNQMLRAKLAENEVRNVYDVLVFTYKKIHLSY